MAMNFFDHQENARRSSRLLVIMFAVAVVALISAFYFFFAFLGIWLEAPSVWQPRTLLWVAGSTILLGGLACWHKISSLRGGGAAVARMLGASRVVVSSDKGDPDEQRYVNVVEEMAIAAGVPVPDIYVMRKEENINAFAAGYSVDDAAVAVTRGCIKRLNRDELQGVVAHEFSHILNGDMRLNILMIGVLAGILFLFAIGYVLFRIGGAIAEYGSRAGILGLPFVVVGGGTCLIGWLGHLFGSVIKAAVSRQREFLADASAVQFTRNPRGIVGALSKIGGYGDGELKNPKASDVAHMCFTSVWSVDFRARVLRLLVCTGVLFALFLVLAGMGSYLHSHALWPLLPKVLLGLVVFQVVGSGLIYLHEISTLTHPPLPERIARILNVRVEAIGPGLAQGGGPLAAGTAGIGGGPVAARKRKTRRKRKAVRTRARDVVKSAGSLTPAAIENAMDTVAGIPAGLSEAGRHPFSAKCLCYLLVLPADKGERRELIKSTLPGLISASELKELVRLEHEMPGLESHSRLPLLETASPSLRQMTREQAREFLTRIKAIVLADKQLDLREFCFLRVIEFCIYGRRRIRRKTSKRYRSIAKLAPDFSRVVSILARSGHDGEEEVLAAFEKARASLSGKLDIQYRPEVSPGKGLLRSIGRLACSSLAIRKEFLAACSECVLADGVVEIEEAELLRAIAHSIGVPLPPILSSPGQ